MRTKSIESSPGGGYYLPILATEDFISKIGYGMFYRTIEDELEEWHVGMILFVTGVNCPHEGSTLTSITVDISDNTNGGSIRGISVEWIDSMYQAYKEKFRI